MPRSCTGLREGVCDHWRERAQPGGGPSRTADQTILIEVVNAKLRIGIFKRHLHFTRHRGRAESDFRVGKLDTAARARQRPNTSRREELGFESWDPRIAVGIQAGDKEGWTAVATGEDVRMVCVMRVGVGPAANTAVDSLLAARGVELEQVETCEVADSTATPALILKVAKNQP